MSVPYDRLVYAIKRAHHFIETDEKPEDIDKKIERVLKSPEMEILVDKKIDVFLSTTKGRILKAMGFTKEYIRPIVLPIVTDMHEDIAELYKTM